MSLDFEDTPASPAAQVGNTPTSHSATTNDLLKISMRFLRTASAQSK